MEKKKFPQTVTRVIVLMICTAFLALSGLAILYRVDNKYTAKTGMVQEHVTLLPAYGAATYRLRIKGEGMAALYLQEPLCAARVFVDGRDLGGPGEVGDVYEAGGADMDRGQAGSYRPLIRDTVYSFPVDGEAELIIQTANYSHYYGGLWFPPAIGSVDSVAHMTASRMVFYGVFCFGSLALSLFCIVLWFGRKEQRDPAAFWFGLLCLTFALRVCYPFFRLWGVPFVRPLSAEFTARCVFPCICFCRITGNGYRGLPPPSPWACAASGF